MVLKVSATLLTSLSSPARAAGPAGRGSGSVSQSPTSRRTTSGSPDCGKGSCAYIDILCSLYLYSVESLSINPWMSTPGSSSSLRRLVDPSSEKFAKLL